MIKPAVKITAGFFKSMKKKFFGHLEFKLFGGGPLSTFCHRVKQASFESCLGGAPDLDS